MVAPRQKTQKVLSSVYFVNLRSLLEAFGGGSIEGLDLQEYSRLLRQSLLDFLKYEDAVEVDEVLLELSPFVYKFKHILDDPLNFQKSVDQVLDVGVCFQDTDSEEIFFKHDDELRQLFDDNCGAILSEFEVELSASHFFVKPFQCLLYGILFGSHFTDLLYRLQLFIVIQPKLDESVHRHMPWIYCKAESLTDHLPVTRGKTFGSQGAQHRPIPLEMVECVNHKLLQFLLPWIVDHQRGLLEPLELILPLLCLHLNEASVKLLELAFNPFWKSLTEL